MPSNFSIKGVLIRGEKDQFWGILNCWSDLPFTVLNPLHAHQSNVFLLFLFSAPERQLFLASSPVFSIFLAPLVLSKWVGGGGSLVSCFAASCLDLDEPTSVCVSACVWLYVYPCVSACVWLYVYLCVSACVWLYVYPCVSVCVWLYVYPCVSVCVWLYVYLCVSVCVWLYVYPCVSACVWLYVYPCVSVCVPIHAYVGMYRCVWICVITEQESVFMKQRKVYIQRCINVCVCVNLYYYKSRQHVHKAKEQYLTCALQLGSFNYPQSKIEALVTEELDNASPSQVSWM